MGICVLYRCGVLGLFAGVLVAQRAPIPRADELPGSPFAIRKTWVIGGAGSWDYLTLDPVAGQLFVTHQTKVQVVDIASGAVAGEVSGFGEAHAVALDPNGQTGYVSDGRSNKVFFFDRRTFQVTGFVEVPASPRALVFERATGMLVAFGALPVAPPPPRDAPKPSPSEAPTWWCTYPGNRWPPPPDYQSVVSIIDPEKKARIADVQVCGLLGAAEADGAGQAWFSISNFNSVGRLSIFGIVEMAHNRIPAELNGAHGSIAANGTLLLDFRARVGPHYRTFRLGNRCRDARAVAVDVVHQRLFAACANQVFTVVATDTGTPMTELTIGPGADAMAYDASRGLIFTANGGGYGSVTIIRQHLTDSYAVIQNLPTLQQARTMAVDPSSGLVYLVTSLYGADLRNPPANGIGTLKLNPVDGSFRVLVIGN
jgi:DNA-binding beta-propeller fold protein YncE